MKERKLYVGNLAFGSTEDDLRAAFASYGTITSVNIVTERDTGRSRGFAFVEMESAEDAERAIAGLNASDLGGRQMQVSIAKPRAPRDNGGARSRW